MKNNKILLWIIISLAIGIIIGFLLQNTSSGDSKAVLANNTLAKKSPISEISTKASINCNCQNSDGNPCRFEGSATGVEINEACANCCVSYTYNTYTVMN